MGPRYGRLELSTTPQQRGESDSERGSDEISEGGYGSARLEDEEGELGQSGESEEGGEDEEEEGNGGIKPRQSPPDVSLTLSPRRNAPLLSNSHRISNLRKRGLARACVPHTATREPVIPPWWASCNSGGGGEVPA